MKVEFVSRARAELFAASYEYDLKRQALGDQFLDEAQRTISYIAQYPEGRLPFIGETRRWPMSRFPYGRLYAVLDDQVYVLAVGHLRRDPKFWRRKAKRRP